MEIRNVALIGHTGEGKTTLAEAMLFNAKAIDRMGKVSDGNTVMDYDEQELQRKISISLSCAGFTWNNCKINILDVPGFFDFKGEMIQALRVCDFAVAVLSAQGGELSVGDENAIEYCIENKIPLMIFVNQMDKENADYNSLLNVLKERYKGKIAPLFIPVMEGNKMLGYADVLGGKAYNFTDGGQQETDISQNLKAECDAVTLQLTESAAETDEALMEKYFADGALSAEEIAGGFKKGILNCDAIPVLCGIAFQNKGVTSLMDAIVKYMPCFGDTKAVAAQKDDGGEIEIERDENQPFSAFIFKTIADPFVRQNEFVPRNFGKITSGVTVYNASKEKSERIGGVLCLKAKAGNG